MFKYVKTIGAHCGAPEPEKMSISNATAVTMGSICEMNSGNISCDYTEGKSKFITLEDKAANDGKTKIKCIRILPGMLFSVEFSGTIANVTVGTLVSPKADSAGFYTSCTEGSGILEVVDKSEYASTGRITVTIHC